MENRMLLIRNIWEAFAGESWRKKPEQKMRRFWGILVYWAWQADRRMVALGGVNPNVAFALSYLPGLDDGSAIPKNRWRWRVGDCCGGLDDGVSRTVVATPQSSKPILFRFCAVVRQLSKQRLPNHRLDRRRLKNRTAAGLHLHPENPESLRRTAPPY